jgi:hypothetical protein
MTRTAWLATCCPTARAIICRYCSINLGKLALLARLHGHEETQDRMSRDIE